MSGPYKLVKVRPAEAKVMIGRRVFARFVQEGSTKDFKAFSSMAIKALNAQLYEYRSGKDAPYMFDNMNLDQKTGNEVFDANGKTDYLVVKDTSMQAVAIAHGLTYDDMDTLYRRLHGYATKAVG